MAVILCVISYNYDEKTEKTEVVQEIHVMGLDENDKLLFVTKDPDLALQFEKDFPPLYLKKGDFAPVALVAQVPQTECVPKFEIYYHGDQAKFKCGDKKAQAFEPKVHGVASPGGHG